MRTGFIRVLKIVALCCVAMAVVVQAPIAALIVVLGPSDRRIVQRLRRRERGRLELEWDAAVRDSDRRLGVLRSDLGQRLLEGRGHRSEQWLHEHRVR